MFCKCKIYLYVCGMKKETAFQVIARKLQEIEGWEVKNLRRTKAGRNMLSSGAFCWIGDMGSMGSVGSSIPASELAKESNENLKVTYCNWNGAFSLERK